MNKINNKAQSESLKSPQKLIPLFLFIYTVLFAFSIFYLFNYAKIIIISDLFQVWASLAYGYWIAISFILAQIGLGRLTMRLPIFRDSNLTGITFLIFSFGIGFYITNCFFTLSAIFKWIAGFSIYTYIVLSVPLIIIGYRTFIDFVYLHKEFKDKSSDSDLTKRWIIWLVGFLFLIWILPYFIQTLLPNTDWDGAWQHLPLPKLFLERGISWVNPSFMQYNFPGAVHLIFSLFFFINAESAIIPFNFIIALGIVVSTYYFADHFFGKYTARWAAVITTAINIMWEVSLTPRIDSFLTFFCLLSVYAFFLWINNSKKSSLLIVSGMMLGMAVGIKYTAAAFIFVLALLGVVHVSLNYKKKSPIKSLPLILTLTTLLIPSGWWYARNAIKLGDPIYPFISKGIVYDSHGKELNFYPAIKKHVENMPSHEKIEAAFNKTGLHMFIDWENNPDRIFKQNNSKDKRLGLFNIWDIFKNPENYQRKPYHEINPLLLLFILLPFFDRRKISLSLYVIGCFVFVSIAAKTHILRYVLPVFPLFSIGASKVLTHFRPRKLIVFALIFISIFLIRFSYLETKKLIEISPWTYLSGKEERIDWLTHVGYNVNKTTPFFIKYVNNQVDKGLIGEKDILFMIGEGKGNLLKCQYLPDSSRNAMPWLQELIKANNDYPEIIKSLKDKNISYLAINYLYLYWSFFSSNDYPKSLIFSLYHLQLFLENHTEIIYNSKSVVLAKIK